MKLFLLAMLLCAVGQVAFGVDTDGDGLLDLSDVSGFNPNATGGIDYCCRGIQDLDGAKLLTNAQGLSLHGNQITSIENGDFQGLDNLRDLQLWNNRIASIENGAFDGLDNLQWLGLSGNQITSLENGAFRGLDNLRVLDLFRNQITELNLTGATFSALRGGYEIEGFHVDPSNIAGLTLDDAVLSQRSFQAIIGRTEFISKVSLVGLAFSDGSPANLSALLNIETLDYVRVDQALFDRYAAEFNAFDAIPGNSVTVVPEPQAAMLVVLVLVALSCGRRMDNIPTLRPISGKCVRPA
jgi:hypothetical protein